MAARGHRARRVSTRHANATSSHDRATAATSSGTTSASKPGPERGCRAWCGVPAEGGRTLTVVRVRDHSAVVRIGTVAGRTCHPTRFGAAREIERSHPRAPVAPSAPAAEDDEAQDEADEREVLHDPGRHVVAQVHGSCARAPPRPAIGINASAHRIGAGLSERLAFTPVAEPCDGRPTRPGSTARGETLVVRGRYTGIVGGDGGASHALRRTTYPTGLARRIIGSA